MAHTLSIDNMSTSVVDVSVPQFDKTKLKLVAVDKDDVRGTVEARYVYQDGDPLYPTTVVVRYAADPKDKARVIRCLVAINTHARDVDGVTGVEVVKPFSIVTSMQIPSMSIEAGDLVNAWLNLASLGYTAINTKVPNDAVMSGLLFGLVQAYS